MAPDSIIVQWVGSLLLALLTGSWTTIPTDQVTVDQATPIVFAAQWPVPGVAGHRVDRIDLAADGVARLGGTSSIVSPRRSPGPGTSN